MAQKVIFRGDELELLMAMDKAGCVLTDDGKFYCDLENPELGYNSRLSVRVKGTYTTGENGWKIAFQAMPGPRTMVIGCIFTVFFLVMLVNFLTTGEGLTGLGFSLILCAAMVINYLAQYKGCVKRFANAMTK